MISHQPDQTLRRDASVVLTLIFWLQDAVDYETLTALSFEGIYGKEMRKPTEKTTSVQN